MGSSYPAGAGRMSKVSSVMHNTHQSYHIPVCWHTPFRAGRLGVSGCPPTLDPGCNYGQKHHSSITIHTYSRYLQHYTISYFPSSINTHTQIYWDHPTWHPSSLPSSPHHIRSVFREPHSDEKLPKVLVPDESLWSPATVGSMGGGPWGDSSGWSICHLTAGEWGTSNWLRGLIIYSHFD